MKISCTNKNLNLGLSVCARIIGGGTALPVLNNILLQTDNGRLKISATNLEMAITTWVGGKIEEEGEITIPARLMSEYVNSLSGEKITLTTKGPTLILEGEKAETHIKGLGAEEFPLIPKIGEEIYGKVDGKKLRSAIRQIIFAAAYSETQPEISGILFSFEGGKLAMAATDRYRLAEAVVEMEGGEVNGRRIIVPKQTALEIGRVAGEGPVEVILSEGQICFKTDSTQLISRLIEGQYPDYKQIIPKGFSTEAETDREELVQALKGASLFATENNNVELEINPAGKRILIKSQSAQVGESEIRVDGTVTGGKNAIIFNHRYLLDCLGNLGDEKVRVKVIDSASPAQFEPVGRDNYLYVVMPIKT